MQTAAVKCVAVILFLALVADKRKVVITIKTNRLTGGGICAALCLVMLLLSSVIPNLKLAFLFASSIIIGICLLRYKLASALICYIAASLIAVLFLPNKLIGMAFFVLFGNYPIIKLYIEKTKNIIAECVIKFVVANIYLVAVYIVLRALESYTIFDFNAYLLYFAGIALLLFYDLAFSFVINAFYKSYYKYLK